MKNYILKIVMSSALFLQVQGMIAQECNIPMSAIVDEGFANVTSETASALQTQLERLITQSKLDVGWKMQILPLLQNLTSWTDML